jgi:uncharacterized protein (TIGR01777 family)
MMKILISGASGLIGSTLCNDLRNNGHIVWRLVRHKAGDKEVEWNPVRGEIDQQLLEGFDAVINLAGENVTKRPWSEKVKKEILESRVQGTQLLAKALAQLVSPPNVLISASAIGIYGNTGERICTETTAHGGGFFAEVCTQWEEATAAAQLANIRTVHTRFGVVLSEKGGALSKMLLPFKMGLGGVMGTGEQYMSWVCIDDVIDIINLCLTNYKISWPVTVVAPFSVSNTEFTKKMGKVLGRPTFLRIPAPLLRWLTGKEMADEFFLSSTRVRPQRLLELGYTFQYPDLEAALRYLLGRVVNC